MPEINYGSIATQVGLTKLNNAVLLNTPINITQIKLGDSNGTEYTPDGSETDLKNVVFTGIPNSIIPDPLNPDGQASLELVVPSDAPSFHVREMGCYDADGDLIYIAAIYPRFKPVTSAQSVDMSFEIMVTVLNSDNITVEIDTTKAVATHTYVQNELAVFEADAVLKRVAAALNEPVESILLAEAGQVITASTQYFYNPVDQKTYSRPSSVDDDELIVSVVGDQLETNSGFRTLTTINKSGIEFETIADIDLENSTGGKISLLLGDFVAALNYSAACDSGILFYRVVSFTGQVDDGGKHIYLPTSNVWIEQSLKKVPTVKDFGAGAGVTNDDTQRFYNTAAATSGGTVLIPTGDYAVNLVLSGNEKWEGVNMGSRGVAGNSSGTRLIPFTVGVDCVKFLGPIGFAGLKNVAIESGQDKNSPTHTGRGLVLEAYSPAYITASAFKDIYIRGFDDGFVIDCNINASEIFDNSFENIECIDCIGYSQKVRGVYNTYKKMFATQCGNYAFYNDGSNCTFNTIIGDGKMAFKGGGQQVTNAVIEAIHANPTIDPTTPAFEINGNTSTFTGCRLNGVANTDYQIGFSVFGLKQTLDNLVIVGAMPDIPIRIQGGSSGTLNNVSCSGATNKISPALAGGWKFIHNVSDVWDGETVLVSTGGIWTPVLDRTITPPTLTPNVSQGVWTKNGRLVTLSCRINLASVTTQGAGTWKITGSPFTASNSQGSIRFAGVVGQSEIFQSTGVYVSANSSDLVVTLLGAQATGNAGTGSLVASITFETDD